jgi:hypothetical protein
MLNEPYEVVAVVVPEEGPQATLPQTVLVKIFEDDSLPALESTLQEFVAAEKPQSLYRTIPVGSEEDFVEYWIDYPSDATERADRLREQLAEVYHHSKQAST